MLPIYSLIVPDQERILSVDQWVDSIRRDFPALNTRRNNRPPVYLDNACTTLVPDPVIRAMNEYYTGFPACGGGRSRYWFADEVNSRLEGDPQKKIKGSRQIIRDFIHARSEKEIIFTQNTTQAINLVALGYRFKPEDVILLSDREHNSNLVPWLRLQKLGLARVDHLLSAADESFDLDQFRQKLKNRQIKLVSLAYTSNLTGYTIPAREIIKLAHEFGARVLLDGAQTLPHMAVDVQDLDVDFLAFSIHKMCGPRGVGVLYGKQELLGRQAQEQDVAGMIEPVILGGGTVLDSTYSSYELLAPPERFEAGVQNYPGQIAAGTAIEYLLQTGLDKINAYEQQLNRFITGELLDRYGDTGWFKIIGPREAGQRGGILSFEIQRPNAVGIAAELSEKNNIMIRDGVFCVHSYFNQRYGSNWMRPQRPSEHRMINRISLYFYNTREECRLFLDSLEAIFKERSYI
jgi:cysteine desulfurase / selenocysteine lyase